MDDIDVILIQNVRTESEKLYTWPLNIRLYNYDDSENVSPTNVYSRLIHQKCEFSHKIVKFSYQVFF